ncbi:DUF397 domain-containing protein [Sphaerisporangium sp. NPDC004334]
MSQAKWRKSSRSSGQGGNCVEIALVTYMDHMGGRPSGDPLRLIRDSKQPDNAPLTSSPAAWSTFIAGLKEGSLHP